jgi:2-methylcitrate dehydratase PrpD
VLCSGERTGLLWAALVNGIAMHVEDFDDTHLRTVVHPGAPVVAAALAAAEFVRASGAELAQAVLVGVEVALRVALGLGDAHFDIGWHVTGTAGHLGAAAAAARLLGLDAAQAGAALALASSEAAGLTEANGSMTKSLHPGKAAADGVQAALLARRGLSAPADPIGAHAGLADLASHGSDLAAMTDGLGAHWHAGDNTFKPYACGIVSHAVIDAGIQLRDRLPGAAAIEQVEVRVPPVVLDVMGIADPQNGLQSKFSVYHCFAVGLLRGEAGPRQFSDTDARAPDIVALRRRVWVQLDPALAKDEADVLVTLAGGEQVREHVRHATGSLDRPMTEDQLRDKCRSLAGPVLMPQATEQLLSLLLAVDRAPSVSSIVELVAGGRR